MFCSAQAGGRMEKSAPLTTCRRRGASHWPRQPPPPGQTERSVTTNTTQPDRRVDLCDDPSSSAFLTQR